MNFNPEQIKFDEQGLVPAIVQDAATRRILMLAYMNRESLARTLEEKQTWFWSRSRRELWHKGATSGHTQNVVEVRTDCDADSLVILVEPGGPACHTGAVSCFEQEEKGSVLLDKESLASKDSQEIGEVLTELYKLIEQRRTELPEGSYTTYLFTQGLDKILKKVGEEAAETIIAAKNEAKPALVAETSDLLYHLLVLMVERGVTLDDIRRELSERRR